MARSVPCDDYFASVQLLNYTKKEFQLSVAGTIRENKCRIPIPFIRPAAPDTANYAYNEGNILPSCILKKNELVLSLSGSLKFEKIDSY